MGKNERTMPRILFVANFVRNHVMEFHLPYLKLLKERGWETAVAAKNDYPDDPPRIPYCDRFYNIDFERQPFKAGNIRAYRQLRQVIGATHYDVIHCHVHVCGVLTRLAALGVRRREGTKVLYTAHGFYFFRGGPLRNWFFYPVERTLARVTDILVTVNHADYALAKRFAVRDQRLIPGVGVDAARFRAGGAERAALRAEKRAELGIPADAPALISVGEVNRNKNQRVALEALARMETCRPYYIICGEGAELPALRERARELGLEDRVRFVGYQTNVASYLYASDIFVFPSRREALGIAALEAMTAGLPLVASPVGGILEYAVDGVTGALVEDTEDPEGYARAIEGLLRDPEACRRIGAHNRVAAEPFALERVLPMMEDVYMSAAPEAERVRRRAV